MADEKITARVPTLIHEMAEHYTAPDTGQRYGLPVVLVRRQGGELTVIATDGSQMAVLRETQDGEDFEAMLPRDLLCSVRPSTRESHLTLSLDAERSRFALTDRYEREKISGAVCQEGTFPDVEFVIPEHSGLHETAPVIGVCPWRLQEAGKLGEAFNWRLGDNKTGQKLNYRWQHGKNNRPMRLDMANNRGTRLTIVLMPAEVPDV